MYSIVLQTQLMLSNYCPKIRQNWVINMTPYNSNPMYNGTMYRDLFELPGIPSTRYLFTAAFMTHFNESYIY